MSDKQLVIELPEELLKQAAAAQIDMRAVVEKALMLELAQRQNSINGDTEKPGTLSMAEKRELLRQMLPPERLNEALRSLDEGKRILGLLEGQIRVSNDFDEPLPDEF